MNSTLQVTDVDITPNPVTANINFKISVSISEYEIDTNIYAGDIRSGEQTI